MKNILFAITITVVLFTACSTDNKTEKELTTGRINMLLSNSVPVSHLFLFDTVILPAWQKELKANEFIRKIFDKVLHSEITVYDPTSDDTSHIASTKENILERLNQQKGLQNLDEIKSLFFKEEWFLDSTEPFLFEKKVNCWYPVRHYLTENNEERMKLIFRASGGNPSELLAKNVIYEFDLEDTLNPEFTLNINVSKLSSLIINKVLNGNTKAYNPLDTNQIFTREQVLSRMGATKDTVFVDDPTTGEQTMEVIDVAPMFDQVTSMIFVEDWYYDPKTFAIKKVIKGIGPVRHYFKGNENVKVVVFMMYLGQGKTKLFN